MPAGSAGSLVRIPTPDGRERPGHGPPSRFRGADRHIDGRDRLGDGVKRQPEQLPPVEGCTSFGVPLPGCGAGVPLCGTQVVLVTFGPLSVDPRVLAEQQLGPCEQLRRGRRVAGSTSNSYRGCR